MKIKNVFAGTTENRLAEYYSGQSVDNIKIFNLAKLPVIP
jgi:hypothetical protein